MPVAYFVTIDGGRRSSDRGFIFRFECKTTTTCAEVDSASSSYPHFLSALLFCSLCLAKLRRRRTGRERGRLCAAGREREQGRRNTQWPPPGRKGRSPLHTTRRRHRRRRRRVRRTNRAHPREQRLRRGGARTGRKERVGEEGREDDLIGLATAMWRKNSSRAHRPTLLTMD